MERNASIDEPWPTAGARGFGEWIDLFNRKERYYVFTQAVGMERMTLGAECRVALSACIGVPVPPTARAYIDYHLDWIHAATVLPALGNDGAHDNKVLEVAGGNQEDIDLLVVFGHHGREVAVLIEAKGATGWTNDQMDSKYKRLGKIFGQDGTAVPGVQPLFVLWSPREQRRLNVPHWPTWMRDGDDVRWMELVMPTEKLMSVTRTDQSGRPDKDGGYWATTRNGKPVFD